MSDAAGTHAMIRKANRAKRLALLKRLLSKPGFIVGLAVIIPMALVTIFAHQLAPYPPDSMENPRYLPPGSEGHILGTDNLGRDVLSRLMFGGRISLVIGLVVVGIGASVGTVLGVVAGYARGVVDNVIMRVVDVTLAFPDILLALLLITMLGPGIFNVMIALGISGIPGYIRLVRGITLGVRELEFVEASRGLGSGQWRLLFTHIIPNVVQPVLVLATLGVATSILAGAGLSFLGLGAPPGTPEWGAMLNDARPLLRRAGYLATIPGITITVAVLAISMLGDAVREVFDPRIG